MKTSSILILLCLILSLAIGLLVAATFNADAASPLRPAAGAVARRLAAQPSLARDHSPARLAISSQAGSAGRHLDGLAAASRSTPPASAAKPLTHPWLGSLVPTQRGAVSWNGGAG